MAIIVDRYKTKTKTKTQLVVTTTVEDILARYDADDLLRTVPYNIQINREAVRVYENKNTPTKKLTLTLSEQMYNWLTDLSENNNIPIALLFNFLIETIANCGRVHTKDIKHALDCYYYSVAHDKTLFSRILSAYAESNFYDPDEGLSEEGVAYFLATSETGRSIIAEYEINNKETGK